MVIILLLFIIFITTLLLYFLDKSHFSTTLSYHNSLSIYIKSSKDRLKYLHIKTTGPLAQPGELIFELRQVTGMHLRVLHAQPLIQNSLVTTIFCDYCVVGATAFFRCRQARGLGV